MILVWIWNCWLSIAMTDDKLEFISIVQVEKGREREEDLLMYLVEIIPF